VDFLQCRKFVTVKKPIYFLNLFSLGVEFKVRSNSKIKIESNYYEFPEGDSYKIMSNMNKISINGITKSKK